MKLRIKYDILYILFILIFCSCTEKREINITGYAYKDDIIKVYDEESNLIYTINVEENEEDITLCALYEFVQVYQKKGDFKLKVTLDSSNIRLVDTLMLISKSNKKPFILFSDPADTNFKRIVGIHDNADYFID